MAWSKSVPPPANIPLATLLRIDYKKLVAGDVAEIERLFSACKNTGFFYLDLHGYPILNQVDDQFAICAELFDLDDKEKRAHLLKMDSGKNLFTTSYKPPGLGKVDHAGSKDWVEHMNIAAAEVFDDNKSLNAPEVLNRRNKDLRTFINNAHSILTVLFKCLETSLNLPPNTLTSMHTIGKSSTTQLRLTCAPPTKDVAPTSLLAHCDASSLTLLFNRLSGLQILPLDAETDNDWLWVQPLPGYAVVNIGDAMSIFTNGLLESIRHRVVRSWGREAEYKRYSVLYGLRPNDDTIMSEIGNDGKPVAMANGEKAATAAEWGDAKFKFVIAGRGFVRDPTKKVEIENPRSKMFGY